MRRSAFALALVTACSSSTPTTFVVDLSLAPGFVAPKKLYVSVYDNKHALKLLKEYDNPSLPGRLILQPPDVDQELRIAVDDKAPTPGEQAGAFIEVRAFARGEIALVLGAPVDTDDDGVPDAIDNCREVANIDQANAFGFGMGDACRPIAVNDFAGVTLDLANRPCSTTMVTTLAGDGNAGYVDGAALTAEFRSPWGLAYDRIGGKNLYVTESAGHRVRVVDVSAGTVATVTGTGSPGYLDGSLGAAQFNSPTGILFDGQLVIADTGNFVLRLINLPPSTMGTLTSGSGIQGYQEGNGMSARYNGLDSLTEDSTQNVFIADENNYRIRRLDNVAGTTTTFAGDGTSGFRDGAGSGIEISSQIGLWFDVGNLYVADGGNHRVRVIDAGGNSSTVAGSGTPGNGDGPAASATFNVPSSVTRDAIGDLYVLDSASGLVRRISGIGPGQRVDTVAGNGLATPFVDGMTGCDVSFNNPRTIVAGNGRVLYVADTGNQRIRKITY